MIQDNHDERRERNHVIRGAAGKELRALFNDLRERRKELDCLYQLEEVIQETITHDLPLETMFEKIIALAPNGWQFPDLAQVKITYLDQVFAAHGYMETPWRISSDIITQERVIGRITVSYRRQTPVSTDGIFLREELQLLKTIADRIGYMVLHKTLKESHESWKRAEEKLSRKTHGEWRTIVDLMHSSNPKVFMYLSQNMLYYLCWNGVEEAKRLLEQTVAGARLDGRPRATLEDMNQPSPRESMDTIVTTNYEIFRIASENLGEEQILSLILQWVEDDKSRFLVKTLENPNVHLSDLINALTRFRYLGIDDANLSPAIEKSLRVSLIRYFLSDDLEFIKIAKNHIQISDYYELVKRVIFPASSRGKLGGKSAGLFLASQIIGRVREKQSLFAEIMTPKTWYVTSDSFLEFLHYNNLESILEQKYKEMDEIHVEYPNIIQIFKNSHFPPEIVRGLSLALEDLGERPIIVRSSSLLEDRLGAAFSGKYKSLFLANRGGREQRLEALMDAIAEVYASTFGPDPIEYRKSMGLVDFHEEMGIMIQEVVGTQVGDYFLPTFAGVAFSNNEFRWSSRIAREDGLLRLTPGLGTRAVDRVADDYPILIAPGKPDLRVNITPDEVIRYSPKNLDVINLKSNAFETVAVDEFIRNYGDKVPGILNLASVIKDDLIQRPTSLYNIDFENEKMVVTFEGLLKRTEFIRTMDALLKELSQSLGTPVDLEFAHDGARLYLLQCRSQSNARDVRPAPIPKDISRKRVVFSARRYVSNGFVPDITHVVYVDPEAYNRLSELSHLKAVGRCVGRLNKLLPKRQFILMGPGRWGSRGDIRLGVEVTYSDINNTAVLIEMAKKKGSYSPELSFGTHFFQDLVEASIRYLPLYPDDEGVIFNESFFLRSNNILADLAPEYAFLSDVVRVVDVPGNADGAILRLLMNAELDEALAIFTEPGVRPASTPDYREQETPKNEDFWRWRFHMAERIAERLDGERLGVKGIYLFGSTKNATAGLGSDIDLLIHDCGDDTKRAELARWLDGWSQSLAEMNYQRTGYRMSGLLDVHYVTDEDIRNKNSYAVKIGAVTDAARLLRLYKTDSSQ